jgi:hypothetical protein
LEWGEGRRASTGAESGEQDQGAEGTEGLGKRLVGKGQRVPLFALRTAANEMEVPSSCTSEIERAERGDW